MYKGKLTVTIGISGSGKPTWAFDQMDDNTVIVNRDKIRELIFGYNESTIKDYYKRDDIASKEKLVTRYEDTLIHEGLVAGKHVIVDATHLNRSYLERFKYWNVPVELKTFSTTVRQAVARDMKRIRKVGDKVILKQFDQLKSLQKSLVAKPIDFTPVTFENNFFNPSTVIFDIDGTLAHMKNRSPFDWKKVGEDEVDYEVACALLAYKSYDIPVTICTGRDGISEYNTKKWLEEHDIRYNYYFTRKKGDFRPDWIVKEEMWREIAKTHSIVGIYDDRLQVVRRARALGLKVFNVEYHNF